MTRFAADRPLGVAPATALDYRELARRRLPRQLFDYVDGGAYDEVTMRANVADLGRVLLRQVVMRDVSERDPAVEVLGQELALPIVLWAGRSVRRDASGGLRTDGRASTLLDALPALLWTTDRRLRLTGSIGGGLHSLGLPSARIREMPLAEFFHDLQVCHS